MFFLILAEGPSVAREKKNFEVKKFRFILLCHPRITDEFPQKISAHLVLPYGRPEETYIYECFVLLYRF